MFFPLLLLLFFFFSFDFPSFYFFFPKFILLVWIIVVLPFDFIAPPILTFLNLVFDFSFFFFFPPDRSLLVSLPAPSITLAFVLFNVDFFFLIRDWSFDLDLLFDLLSIMSPQDKLYFFLFSLIRLLMTLKSYSTDLLFHLELLLDIPESLLFLIFPSATTELYFLLSIASAVFFFVLAFFSKTFPWF